MTEDERALGSGGHFGETVIADAALASAKIDCVSAVEAYSLPLAVIAGIPVVRWKLYEAHRWRFWGEGAGAAA